MKRPHHSSLAAHVDNRARIFKLGEVVRIDCAATGFAAKITGYWINYDQYYVSVNDGAERLCQANRLHCPS